MKLILSALLMAAVNFFHPWVNAAGRIASSPEDVPDKKTEVAARILFEPISHASFVIRTSEKAIYIDPVGNKKLYDGFPVPDMILITHLHRDHLDPDLVTALRQNDTVVIGPEAVIKKLGFGDILRNGQKKRSGSTDIEAVPMYNTTKDRLSFHKKGEGNGYILTLNKKRIYISGDTEDIPEMRRITGIDYAFICMNLPYTMTVEQAASAVLAFKPRVVFPYHFRSKSGEFSNIDKFKESINSNNRIEVRVLEWYKN